MKPSVNFVAVVKQFDRKSDDWLNAPERKSARDYVSKIVFHAEGSA